MRCRSAAAPATSAIEATPLVEDGFLYITDSWGVLYKIDGTSGDVGRIVWRMDPKQEQQATNRGAALWGNLVITAANDPARIIATDKETGKVVWETNVSTDTPDVRITGGAARDQGQDHRRRRRRRQRRARLDGRRSTPRPASCCGASTPSRRRASPAARPGRTTTTPGRPAAAPCG